MKDVSSSSRRPCTVGVTIVEGGDYVIGCILEPESRRTKILLIMCNNLKNIPP